MPIIVSNTVELLLSFEKQLDEVIRIVTEKVLDDLKIIVQNFVYDPYTSRVAMYKRTGEFGEAWDKDKVNGFFPSSNSIKIQNRVFYDFSNMRFSEADYQHGSPLSGDVSQYLAEILNEGKTGSIFGSANPPAWWRTERPFWEVFIWHMDNGLMFTYLEKEFKKRKMNIIRV